MNIRPPASVNQPAPGANAPQAKPLLNAAEKKPDDAYQQLRESAGETPELKEVFTEFVGQTMFGSMLASMRKSAGKPAYMHGGRTEEVFQKQLDQVFVEELTESSADSIADPMFDLFVRRSA